MDGTERNGLQKSWKRALNVRKNNFTSGLKQVKSNLDKEFIAFIHGQNAQKKKLADDSDKRERVRKISREAVEDAFRRQDALSRLIEELDQEINLVEMEFSLVAGKKNPAIARDYRSSKLRKALRNKSRAFSRSAEDLRTLFSHARNRMDGELPNDDSELKLPRIQMMSSLCTPCPSPVMTKTIVPTGKQEKVRKGFTPRKLEPITEISPVRSRPNSERFNRNAHKNALPVIMVTSHISRQAEDSEV